MRVVEGTGRDVGPVWDMLQRCRVALDAEGIHQWDDIYPTRAIVEKDVRRGALFVLEDDGRCVASVALDERQAKEYRSVVWTGAEPVLVVHRLCVDPMAQGRGLAHQLMDYAEQYAVRHGYASVRLDAYSGNPRSVRLYRRRGYREAGQLFFPRRPLPFHLFELHLAP